MSELTKTLIDLAAWLARLIADLASGKKSEDEARAELIGVGLKVSESDTDAELAEYVKLMGGEPE
jgi:hypothetical protein